MLRQVLKKFKGKGKKHKKTTAQEKQDKFNQMDAEAKVFSTALTGKEHESSKSTRLV